MAQSENVKPNGFETTNGDVRREAATKYLADLWTPVATGKTLEERFALANNSVMVNSGSYTAPKRIPTNLDLDSRARFARSDITNLGADEDHSDFVDAVAHVSDPPGRDSVKYAFTEALRGAATTFIEERAAAGEAGYTVTEANIKTVIEMFRAQKSPEAIAKVDRRISDAGKALASVRRNRKQSTKKGTVTPAALTNMAASL